MQQIIFILLALGTLGAAVMVVTSQNLMRSALWLILAFFGIAGIFVMLDAEFLAVTQILIYVGAIAMLIIFAIMLTHGLMDPKQSRFNQQWGVVGGFAALLFVGLAFLVTRRTPGRSPSTPCRWTRSPSWGATSSVPMWCRSRSRPCCWSSP